MPESEKTMMYKVIVSPFSKIEANQIRNYLYAFSKDKTVEIEAV